MEANVIEPRKARVIVILSLMLLDFMVVPTEKNNQWKDVAAKLWELT
jgi:hypothetical protein